MSETMPTDTKDADQDRVGDEQTRLEEGWVEDGKFYPWIHECNVCNGECKKVASLRAQLSEAQRQLAEYEGIEGRCSMGHNKKFTYELDGRTGCVACERDEAQRENERLRNKLKQYMYGSGEVKP